MRRRRHLPMTCLLALFLVAPALAGPAPLPRHNGVIGAGGSVSRVPAGQILFATVGQPVVGITRNEDHYYLIHGYHTLWHPHVTAARHWSLY